MEENMKQTFFIFYYVRNGQKYVEAYPAHDLKYSYESLLPEGMPSTFMICNSRTQARREAYKLWIEPSGKGFNKMPHPRKYTLK
jgi:hypothetical protein